MPYRDPLARRHYAHNHIIDPTHDITVTLVGVGGTGSVMLGLLARIHYSLLGLNREAGLKVQVFDPGEVREANVIRQLFHPSEIGSNKAIALTTRINRFYGLDWEAYPDEYRSKRKGTSLDTANITITCTDDTQSRLNIKSILKKPKTDRIFHEPMYWLDIGNRERDGQIVLGTVKMIKQPESQHHTISKLPTILELYPDYKYLANESEQGPSCSLMEALRNQDLFINGTLAHLGANLLWKLFKDYYLEEHALFLNLNSNIVKSKTV